MESLWAQVILQEGSLSEQEYFRSKSYGVKSLDN